MNLIASTPRRRVWERASVVAADLSPRGRGSSRRLAMAGLAAIVTLALSACDRSPKLDATVLKEAIDAHLADKPAVCVGTGWSFDFDRAYGPQTARDFPEAIERFRALERAGLAKSVVTRGQETSIHGFRQPGEVELVTWTLTEQGKALNRSAPGGRPNLCFGRLVVKEIVSWSLPSTDDASQATVVTFTIDTTIPEWVTADVHKAFPFIASTVESARTQRRQLPVHRTNRGLEVATTPTPQLLKQLTAPR